MRSGRPACPAPGSRASKRPDRTRCASAAEARLAAAPQRAGASLALSLPRRLAMRRDALRVGSDQVVASVPVCAVRGHRLGIRWLVSGVLGGAIAMRSTALLLQQLTERAELNRAHGRLAFSMLLF